LQEPPEEWPSRLGSCKFNYVVTSNPTNVKVWLERGVGSCKGEGLLHRA
jgi:hypothetical protein